MGNKQVVNSLLLGLMALIWGVAFVAQSVGMDYVGPFTYNSIRCFIGSLILIPVILCMERFGKKAESLKVPGKNKDFTVIGGICCGIVLTVASSFQQIGILYTSVGKAGFITALYIIIVPVLGLFLKKKVPFIFWISVVLAMAGMYFITLTESMTIEKGDFLMFLSAVFFSVHILVIDYFSPKGNGIRMSCIQFFVSGILCGIPMVLLEHPQISNILAAAVPILYAGIMSCGVAYTLQIVAQKNVNPVIASLILSLESVFAALAGWLILGETLSPKEIAGCILVFAAILLAQLPEPGKKRKTEAAQG